MRAIPTIMSSGELLDKAFRRVKKVRVTDLRGVKRARAEATGRLSALCNTVAAQLNRYVRAFPSIDDLHPFERELIEVLIGVDRLKHSLGALDWARKTVDGIHREERAKVADGRTQPEVTKVQNRAYARVSSVLERVSGELDFLGKARDELRRLPDLNLDEPVVVIAGAPNVGKSQLVASISSGKPEVAAYPFTTKGVSLGHMTIGHRRIQVMDTPGLLDRPLEERNEIERQAIAALEHIADIVVFVFDASESCGYPMAMQRSLLDGLRETFDCTPFIIVSNKADLTGPGEGIAISALTGQGVDELLSAVSEKIEK